MMAPFLRLTELAQSGQLNGKRVFIRADLNVPQDDAGSVTDDTRIRASIPAIEMALAAGAAVMVTSHLGRPIEGELKPEDSLAPIAERLALLMKRDVLLKADWVNSVVVEAGQVVLLENCRGNKGEKKNNDELAQSRQCKRDYQYDGRAWCVGADPNGRCLRQSLFSGRACCDQTGWRRYSRRYDF